MPLIYTAIIVKTNMLMVMEVQIGNTEAQSQLRLYQSYCLLNGAGFVKIHHRILEGGGQQPSFTRFLDHTQRHTTVGRTPLDE